MDADDDDLSEGWFAQGEIMGELVEVPDTVSADRITDRRSHLGVILAAVSATALTLVLVLIGRL